jgi:DNA uptake protein ComE-like DNA-binding protein
MAEYILHNGRVREVHGRFSNMILYKDNKEVKGTSVIGVTFCDVTGKPLPDPLQVAIKGEDVIKAESLVKEEPSEVTVRIGNNNPLPREERKEEGREVDSEKTEGRKHDLNRINTETEIRFVAAEVSGLGVKTLKTIVGNRPMGGYRDVEHLREVNGDSIPKNLKWAAMEPYLEFS